jgi:CysZ protein
MTPIFDALVRSFRDLFQPRVLLVVVWPIAAALLLWIALDWMFWDSFSAWLTARLSDSRIQNWLEGVEPHWIATAIQTLAHIILFVPLVFLTALLITALFAMPALIRIVEERDYPQLRRESGGGLVGSLLNALIAVVIFVAIWLVTLPLWLVGAGIVMPFIAAAYLNQRLFRYDALAEHASRAEMRALFVRHRKSWWALGLLTGLLQFVPILNLLAPVLTGLAFIHFGLARLQSLRQPNAPPV